MTAWRQAGLNYINFSTIAARMVRQALKSDLKNEALKRDVSSIKFTPWKDGKAIKSETK
ncbi:protein stunted-like isoform X1 [Ctenocephalides felis]|uniref:protein stunted-like isoform X1 n=1 Tax=Ctenocephalides felis TaxID=7515 RepID=UPI000E6E4D2B|nr:protein stunted-like isoform X1 [Ctenocephalides felis]